VTENNEQEFQVEKNNKLKFPGKDLLSDLNLQRKQIKEMIHFKDGILQEIKDQGLLITSDVDEDSGEETRDISGKMVNIMINLNDTITASWKDLFDSYSKFAKITEAVEKAEKCHIENVYRVNELNGVKPKEDDTTKKKPEDILNKGKNLWN